MCRVKQGMHQQGLSCVLSRELREECNSFTAVFILYARKYVPRAIRTGDLLRGCRAVLLTELLSRGGQNFRDW